MCGICGFAGFNDSELINKMCDVLFHRGPDEEGVLIDEKNKIYLGQKRLSIIDLVTGRQPIYNENNDIAIIFNGEIYNYLELKQELSSKGHIFKTNTDTEVIVHLYEEHGYNLPKYLNGIFSFVIYDKQKAILYGVRDYFGVKPLFYYYDNEKFLFGSEIKAILQDQSIDREINYEALHYTINLRYIPGELTLFKNIFRLKAGHYFIYNLCSKRFDVKRYWDQKYTVNNKMTEGEAIEGVRFYLKQAVKRQLISDVPIGVYLSGGMDSSSIVACASQYLNNVKTFSMGFNEPTDEVSDAKKVADYFKAEFHETFIDLRPLEAMRDVIWHVEEPKINIIQGYFLSKHARQYIKVALSGLGGDELFAGYVNNKYLYSLNALHRIIPKNNILKALSDSVFKMENRLGLLRLDEARRGMQMLLSCGDKTKYYLILRNVWDYDDGFYANIYSGNIRCEMMQYRTRDLFEGYFREREKSIVGQSLFAEFNTKMVDDFLLNEDRTSMANGLEVRVPFLDRDLVKFAFSIPYKYKIKGNNTKYIFRKAMNGILPEYVLEKRKWGFAINPCYQFKKDLKKTAIEVLNEDIIKKQGIFNYEYINKIINYPETPRLRWHYYYLWQLIAFQYWYDMFIKNKELN